MDKVTIFDMTTHEPVLVLSEDEKGIQVSGGDPRMVNSLQLNRFSSISEIFDYINSDPDSGLQAMYGDGNDANEDAPAQEEEQSSEDQTMDKMKGALEIIRALMNKVGQKRDQEKQQKDDKDQEKAKAFDGEAFRTVDEKFLVSFDGDNIGNAIARAEASDDLNQIAEMSAKINAGEQVFADWIKSFGGRVIQEGGDEGMGEVKGSALASIEQFRESYKKAVGATVCVGIGKKPSEATKARELAKLTGKDKVVMFDEGTEKELQLHLENQDNSENTKIKNAMAEPVSHNDVDNHIAANGEQIKERTSAEEDVRPEGEPVPVTEGEQFKGIQGEPENLFSEAPDNNKEPLFTQGQEPQESPQGEQPTEKESSDQTPEENSEGSEEDEQKEQSSQSPNDKDSDEEAEDISPDFEEGEELPPEANADISDDEATEDAGMPHSAADLDESEGDSKNKTKKQNKSKLKKLAGKAREKLDGRQ